MSIRKVIYCAFMRLQSLPYFLEFESVWQELDVSENFIVSLPEDGLASVQVQSVRLSRNAVRHVSTSAFRGLVGVTQLDLAHNQIEHLPSRVFSPLVHLRTLKLRYNRLADIGPQVFHSLPQLYDLDLQVNYLRRKLVLSECRNCCYINLYFNISVVIQVAQLWQRDRAKLDTFAINIQRYSQTHVQHCILGPPYEGIMGNISSLSESFNKKKLSSRVSSRECQFYS